MVHLLEEPALVRLVEREAFDCAAGSLYVYGSNIEQRSAIDDAWQQRQSDRGVKFVEITDQEADRIKYVLPSGDPGEIQLGSKTQASALVAEDDQTPVYLDVTGLSHHVWAPLLRACVDVRLQAFVVYMEPRTYKLSKHPQRGSLYDLSERTEGLRPLPTFASLRPDTAREVILAPLLGFEGARFGQIVSHVEPALGRTFPIVGLPGFRAEYPFVTYWGNQTQLLDDQAWMNIRYAVANDPFDLFHVLRILVEEHPEDLLKVAPIGTKPHSVGAVLFALSRPEAVEIVYDNPVRKPERTSGTARLCIYDVGSFVESDLFGWSGGCALGMLPR